MRVHELRDRLSEADFQSMIVDRARLLGWRVHHDRGDYSKAIAGDPGFPDLVLARGGRVIFAELKGSRGKVSGQQGEWLGALTGTAPQFWRMGIREIDNGSERHEVYVWTPQDWPDIQEVLNES